MTKNIKLLFEQLSEKHPGIFDEKFIEKLVNIMQEAVDSEVKDKVEKAVKDSPDADAVAGGTDVKTKEMTDKEKEDMKESLRKEIIAEDESSMKEQIEKLVDVLDVFCTEAAEEFMTENSEKINESIKTNVSYELVEKLQEVLSTYGISLPTVTIDKEVYEEKITSLNNTIANLTEQLVEQSKDEVKNEAIKIVDDICGNYTEEQTEKFYKLIEDFDVDNLETFKEKVKNLASILEFSKDDHKKLTDDITKINSDSIIDGSQEINEKKVTKPNDSFMDKVKKNYNKK